MKNKKSLENGVNAFAVNVAGQGIFVDSGPEAKEESHRVSVMESRPSSSSAVDNYQEWSLSFTISS